MSTSATDPALTVFVQLPSELARTIDSLAERRGQDRAQFKAVFDAMVFLQAAANPTGPSGECFAHARSGKLVLITSRDKDLLDLMLDPDLHDAVSRHPGPRPGVAPP